MKVREYIDKISGKSKKIRIVAVDFDRTLFDESIEGYPHIGLPIHSTIELVKELQREGWKTILWTCRNGRELEEAINACNKEDLYFDAINDNIDKEENERLSRKVYASLYIDDKAINMLDI